MLTHLSQRVSLVVVEPALHQHQADSLQLSEQEPRLVPWHCALYNCSIFTTCATSLRVNMLIIYKYIIRNLIIFFI